MTENTTPRRRTAAAFGLATLAIGGIGAALTSAAWTDNALFGAGTESATFALQGSLDGQHWVTSNDPDDIKLTVPTATFAKLLPGESRDVVLHVKNAGSVGAALTSKVTMAGSTYQTAPAAAVSGLATSLPSKGTDEFTLTVTAPDDWSPENQGRSGTVIVTVSGEAIAG
ncbi:hypothetical protein [uncultured Aeromicrobium sp.]|uniref:hypothetical protein n=1 Tax=uncultured Aeromicrobium sp. TaxID=337820 RepID=UPI0025EBD4B1|nr:hypothetical protein [uncultured Aeromicrobium sp.]